MKYIFLTTNGRDLKSTAGDSHLQSQQLNAHHLRWERSIDINNIELIRLLFKQMYALYMQSINIKNLWPIVVIICWVWLFLFLLNFFKFLITEDRTFKFLLLKQIKNYTFKVLQKVGRNRIIQTTDYTAQQFCHVLYSFTVVRHTKADSLLNLSKCLCVKF